MIARPPSTVPVPDAVVDLAGRQLPDRVRAAHNPGLIFGWGDLPGCANGH